MGILYCTCRGANPSCSRCSGSGLLDTEDPSPISQHCRDGITKSTAKLSRAKRDRQITRDMKIRKKRDAKLALKKTRDLDGAMCPPRFTGKIGADRNSVLTEGSSYFASHRRQFPYAYIRTNYDDLRREKMTAAESRHCVASWMMSVDREDPSGKDYFVFALAIRNVIMENRSWPKCLGSKRDLGLLRECLDEIPKELSFSSSFKGSSPKVIVKAIDLMLYGQQPLRG